MGWALMLTKREDARALGRRSFMWEVPDETSDSVTPDPAQVTAQWWAAVCTCTIYYIPSVHNFNIVI